MTELFGGTGGHAGNGEPGRRLAQLQAKLADQGTAAGPHGELALIADCLYVIPGAADSVDYSLVK